MTGTKRQPPDVGTIVEDPVHGYRVRFDQIGSATEAAKIEFTAEPQASGPPSHIHPKAYERFEVLSGAVMLQTGRNRRVVETGEKVSVSPGAPHTWFNHTDERAVVSVEMDPGLTMASFPRRVVRTGTSRPTQQQRRLESPAHRSPLLPPRRERSHGRSRHTTRHTASTDAQPQLAREKTRSRYLVGFWHETRAPRPAPASGTHIEASLCQVGGSGRAGTGQGFWPGCRFGGGPG